MVAKEDTPFLLGLGNFSGDELLNFQGIYSWGAWVLHWMPGNHTAYETSPTSEAVE